MRSDKEQTFPLESLYSIVASDDLLASHSSVDFWQYDGENMNELPDFGWNPANGSYHPKYLKKNGELAIWMGDDIGCATEHVSGQSNEDAVSAFFTSGGRHYILTLRKKA